eukprot:Gb_09117 [translate_table: standard]
MPEEQKVNNERLSSTQPWNMMVMMLTSALTTFGWAHKDSRFENFHTNARWSGLNRESVGGSSVAMSGMSSRGMPMEFNIVWKKQRKFIQSTLQGETPAPDVNINLE